MDGPTLAGNVGVASVMANCPTSWIADAAWDQAEIKGTSITAAPS